MKIEVQFKLEKQTPGAVRYMEVDGGGVKRDIAGGASIGILYIRKTAITGDIPQNLKVTIES